MGCGNQTNKHAHTHTHTHTHTPKKKKTCYIVVYIVISKRLSLVRVHQLANHWVDSIIVSATCRIGISPLIKSSVRIGLHHNVFLIHSNCFHNSTIILNATCQKSSSEKTTFQDHITCQVRISLATQWRVSTTGCRAPPAFSYGDGKVIKS